MTIPGAREIPDPEAEMERLAVARKQNPDVDQLRADLDVLLTVASPYLDAFSDDNERMTLPERMRLQDVEDVVARHGRRY